MAILTSRWVGGTLTIIPCYKQAHFLVECVASLQAQTYADWEAIIVNDGSPDDTREIAHALRARETRIRYVEKSNGGLSSARNAGLRVARGRWIQFLDADDLLEPNKLSVQVGQLSGSSQLALTYCDYWLGDERNPRIRHEAIKNSCEFVMTRPVLDMALRWEWEFSIPIHAALFDARFFRDLGVSFDEALPNHEDWDMWMQVLRHEPHVSHLAQELAVYRHCASSMSRNRDMMWRGFTAAVRKQTAAYADDPQVLKALAFNMRLIDYHYLRTWRSRVRQMLSRSHFYQRKCPWSIQRVVAKLVGRPALPASLM